MFIQVVGAFLAISALSIVLRCPKKYTMYTGFVGAVGWMIYLILGKMIKNEVIAIFFAVLVVGLLAQVCARIFKAPVTIFLIAGMIPFVPGVSMYQSVYHTIKNDTQAAGYYFLQTIQKAAVIALAVFITDAIFLAYQKKKISK